MKKFVSPINYYKAMMNGGSKTDLYNSKDKMIKYIKFVSANFYGKLTCLESMRIRPRSPVYNVFKDLKSLRIENHIKEMFRLDLCKYAIDEKNGKPGYDVYYVSKEKGETAYIFHISYIEMLQANSVDSYNLLIECLSWLGKKGIYILDHPYNQYTEMEFYVDMVISRAELLKDDEAKEFALDIYKWVTRDEPAELFKTISRHEPSKVRLKRLIDKLPMSAQYQIKMKEFAEYILEIYNCHPINYYSEASRKEFLERNDLPYDKEEHESQAVDYQDLFYVSWEPSDIIMTVMMDMYTNWANEYGQIEYFAKYQINDYQDFRKLKNIDLRTHAALLDFPELFNIGYEMSYNIEDYFYDKFGEKWTKIIEKHLNPLNADTLSRFIEMDTDIPG